jgi:hypothetical protein
MALFISTKEKTMKISMIQRQITFNKKTINFLSDYLDFCYDEQLKDQSIATKKEIARYAELQRELKLEVGRTKSRNWLDKIRQGEIK